MNVNFWFCNDDVKKKPEVKKRDFCFSIILTTVIFVPVLIQKVIFKKR